MIHDKYTGLELSIRIAEIAKAKGITLPETEGYWSRPANHVVYQLVPLKNVNWGTAPYRAFDLHELLSFYNKMRVQTEWVWAFNIEQNKNTKCWVVSIAELEITKKPRKSLIRTLGEGLCYCFENDLYPTK